MAKIIDKKLAVSLLPYRSDDANKGTFGKVLNIAGSRSYSGAAYLSSISALKIGAGYVALACPEEIIPRISPIAPELVFIPLNSNHLGSISSDNEIHNIRDYAVISIGCGLTTHDMTKDFVFYVLDAISKRQKLIIDADGLNVISSHKGEISLKNAIITPHPRELSRLLNVSTAEILDNREKYARITSQTFECITVLKGYKTIVTDGHDIYINSTGSSALSKAGTGDVLTGIIAGLLSQKLSIFDSAKLGVYLHGLAGDIAASELTKYCVLASDVIEFLPFAMNELLLEN